MNADLLRGRLQGLMGRPLSMLCGLLWLLASAAHPAFAAPDDEAARLALGQRLYREGLLPSGEPVTAIGAAQTPLSGKAAACAGCHRRSGYGTTEGKFAIRPITGPALLQEDLAPVHAPRIKAQLGVRVRPPYTQETLARAISTGVDATGKQMDSLMPRYKLTSEQMAALGAYLFSLSAQDSPGVDDKEIHFATVVQPDVPAAQRRAMLDVLQAFVKDKDANVRAEEARRTAGNMRMYRAYRKWVLHVWELSGPAQGWAAQLEALYRHQPVFALIGGIGTVSWQPIHDFSERMELPALFPQVNTPWLGEGNLYTFYFSRGVTLEAEVLASYLQSQSEKGRVVQVRRAEGPGATAAAALRAALRAEGGVTVEDQVFAGTADAAFWKGIAASKPAAVVLWLDAQDLGEGRALGALSEIPSYLSFQMVGGKRPEWAQAAGSNFRLLYPSDLPPRRDARLLRNKMWLHNKGIALGDETVQFNTLFAVTVASDVIGHMADNFSRDLFVERAEHTVGQMPAASIYPQMSLGPGQRFAAKGAAIIQLSDAEKSKPKLLSTWIVP
jgi:hypothetical protein